MTTRKHEIEEGLQDDRVACQFCMEQEADSICDRCSKTMCIECGKTHHRFGVLCPSCWKELRQK